MRIISWLVVGLLVFTPSVAFANEAITSFESAITIHPSAVVEVVEELRYDFGSDQRHGIFREIPVYYYTDSGILHTPLTILDVTDAEGASYPYTTELYGQNIQIKIGSPKSYVSGEKVYRLHYMVEGVINYFDTHSELYWNVTGNEWSVPIEQARATITLPEPTRSQPTTTCYGGAFGGTNGCSLSEVTTTTTGLFSGAIFAAESLAAGDGLTVVIGFPTNTVAVTEKDIRPIDENAYASDNGVPQVLKHAWLAISIPAIIFVIMFIQWWRYGRDPKGRKIVVAEYGPPDELTPIQVGTLLDESTDAKDISAEIIQLAIQGILTIERIPKKGFLSSDDYKLTKCANRTSLPEYQQLLLDSIFGKKKSVLLSEIRKEFSAEITEISSSVHKSLMTQKYFTEDAFVQRMSYYVRGVGLGVAISLPAFFFGWTLFVATGILSAGVYMFFGHFMPKKTIRGVHATEHILGLKRYITVAEKERIAFHNAPHKDPELFEKLLPYAMVLGVDKQWTDQFADIYTAEPTWYHDPSLTTFSLLALNSGLHTFTTKTATAVTSPSSGGASSGSSGFSGGSSGGGFGGGGGGSW